MLSRQRPLSTQNRPAKGKSSTAREMPSAPAKGFAAPTHEEITRRAYEIFIERGCPEGRAMEHWLEAEGQLITAFQQQETRFRSEPSGKMPRPTAP